MAHNLSSNPPADQRLVMKKRTSERPEQTVEVRAQIVPVAHKLSSNPTADQRSVRKQRTARKAEDLY
jgi:hypothetical protein